MESSDGGVPVTQGPSTGHEHNDALFSQAVDFLEGQLFVRWMRAEALRSKLGGEEATVLFRHPGIQQVIAFLTAEEPLAERYLYKLAARCELLTEFGESRAESITAMIILLSTYAPMELLRVLGHEGPKITMLWIDKHCKPPPPSPILPDPNLPPPPTPVFA